MSRWIWRSSSSSSGLVLAHLTVYSCCFVGVRREGTGCRRRQEEEEETEEIRLACGWRGGREEGGEEGGAKEGSIPEGGRKRRRGTIENTESGGGDCQK